jgi:hypothetical protein
VCERVQPYDQNGIFLLDYKSDEIGSGITFAFQNIHIF